jgi:hypothetical protein
VARVFVKVAQRRYQHCDIRLCLHNLRRPSRRAKFWTKHQPSCEHQKGEKKDDESRPHKRRLPPVAARPLVSDIGFAIPCGHLEVPSYETL